MRTFVFRHGKGFICHNRYKGHRKPLQIKTTGPDGKVHSFSMDWHAAIREDRAMARGRRRSVIDHDHTEMIRDGYGVMSLADSCRLDHSLCGEEDYGGVVVERDGDGRLTSASYGGK